eukprot:COSAG02_NODE_405_length_23022_cov_14.617764_4_plen_110_part_00
MGLSLSIARCGLLWLPASAWVGVTFIVDHSFVEHLYTIDVGQQIIVACSIATTILGVAYELRVYDQEHSDEPRRRQQCGTKARSFAWLCFTLALASAVFVATLYLLAKL